MLTHGFTKLTRSHDGIIQLIGNTPLIPLRRIFAEHPIQLFAKLEMFNPGGSIKDRVARSIITKALADGRIDQATTIIESSSGNLGIGLAQVCRYFGLRFICIVDSRTTNQNIQILRAYGAEVEIISQPDPDLLTARIKRVHALQASIPNSFWCNQYANLHNPMAHYATMSEILASLPSAPDYLFCATSSCGTLRGCAEYIREQGLSTKVIAVDALGSVIFGGQPGQRLIPGHGASRIPELFQPDLAAEVVYVSDADCVAGCHSLLDQEAIFAGGSSGGVIRAIAQMLPNMPANATCVAILCDRGERYLDTVFNHAWIDQHLPSVLMNQPQLVIERENVVG